MGDVSEISLLQFDAVGAPTHANLADAWRAVRALLQAGHAADAADIAEQTVRIARQRNQDDRPGSAQDVPAWRDLAISLSHVGWVAQRCGQWSQAHAAYRESLQICLHLLQLARAEQESDVLREIARLLNRAGQAALAQGDWEEALSAYQEALRVRRRLARKFGEHTRSQRDLAAALANVGLVRRALGLWVGAAAAYSEELRIRRQLVRRLANAPHALRDVSVVLNRIGRLAQEEGDWEQARQAYQESLDIRRELAVPALAAEVLPNVRRELARSIDNLAALSRITGDLPRAARLHDESLLIRRQLAEQQKGRPDALDELALNLFHLARVIGQDARLRLLSEAAAIYVALLQRCPEVARYRLHYHDVQTALRAAARMP